MIHANSGELIRHYAAVRSRLYGSEPPKAPRLRIVAALPSPPAEEPIQAPLPKRRPHEYLFVTRTAYKHSGPRWQHASADVIIAEVCSKHRVSIAEIKGKTRNKAIVAARFEAYALLQEHLGYSLEMIGRTMGGKEHTGVMHGIRVYKARLDTVC